MTKPTKWPVRPAKTQISLGIRPVWSKSSMSTWKKLGSLATHWAHSENSDQTGRMPRLIWVFAELTCHFVDFVMRRLKCVCVFNVFPYHVMYLYILGCFCDRIYIHSFAVYFNQFYVRRIYIPDSHTITIACIYIFLHTVCKMCIQYLYYSVFGPGAVARSEACSLGMQAAPSSIPTSGTFFRGDLVMKTFLRPFSLFRWFKKSSCQILAKECALSTGKLPRRLAQEQCG